MYSWKACWLIGFVIASFVCPAVILPVEASGIAVSLNNDLTDSVRNADADRIREILSSDPTQLEARDEHGWTALMHASLFSDAACVELLVSQGADVQAVNQAGGTALHYAATNFDKTRVLLKAGANVNAITNLGNTPLMLALRVSKSAPVVRLLLGNRADVHARNLYGVTALMIAASSDDVESVELLLDRGADPSLTPYFRALDANGDPLDPVFGGGFNALSWASLKGNVMMAKRLLDAGADVNQGSMFGSPLTCAAQRNRPGVARLLLDRGADVNAIDVPGGFSPLMWAAGNEYGDAETLKLLMERGADVNANHGGSWGPHMGVSQTPLMIAKRRGQTAIVDELRKVQAAEQDDPWAVKVKTPPRRIVSTEGIDTKTLLVSITAAVPLLERTAIDSIEEFANHGFRCITCHNQLLPLMAVGLAKQKGVPHNEKAFKHMLLLETDMPEFQNVLKSEVTFEPNPSSFTGYLLWGLASASIKPNISTDLGVHSVAVYQAEDGSWLQPFPRPPITDSEVSATALGVRALKLYPLPGRQKEMDELVARAQDWLRKTKPRINEDYVYKLLGLYWAGEGRDRLKSLADDLIELQRKDGGWSQLPGLSSDAYATGQSIYALYKAGGLSLKDEVFRNGIAYLLRNQMEDGSWFVRRRAYPFQPTMDANFPHGRDAWISTAATCWAVMALSVGLEKDLVEKALLDGVQIVSKSATSQVLRLPAASTEAVDFDKHILPMLENSCLDCHSSTSPAGEYSLETRESLIKGGYSGPPVVIPGNSADSLLIQHVTGLIEDVEMPPITSRTDYEPLSKKQIGLLRTWIDQGLPGMKE